MDRRRLLKLLGCPASPRSSARVTVMAARSHNRYYQGPPSDHFDGTRFFNPDGSKDRDLGEFLRWQLGGGHEDWADSPFRDRPPARAAGLRVALVGHASLLIQAAGVNWSERASPFSFVGPRRVNPPGIAFEDLPPIDAVLITHNHYDHLDLPTVARLWQFAPAAHHRAARERRNRPRL